MSTIKVDTIATRTGSGDITASNKIITSSGIDLNGTELILDADADTSITADTDDKIDFKIAGSDRGNIHYDGNDFFSLESNDYLTLVQNQTAERGIIFGPTYFKPYNANDNQLDLGIGAARWKDLYLSGGAYIGGTGAANKLDDYEEGTWTPVLTDGSTDVSLGASGSGVYTKIGNLVTVSFDKYNVSISSLNTTDLSIKTLPFASNANSLGNKIIHVTGTSGGSNVPVLVYPVSGSQTLALYKAVSSSQNMAQLTKSDLASSISIRLTLTYFTDS